MGKVITASGLKPIKEHASLCGRILWTKALGKVAQLIARPLRSVFRNKSRHSPPRPAELAGFFMVFVSGGMQQGFAGPALERACER